MTDTKTIVKAGILFLIFFLWGRFSRGKSDEAKGRDIVRKGYDDYIEDIDEEATKGTEARLADDGQRERARELNKAFARMIGGFIPNVDEDAINAIFQGFMSETDFARFQAIYNAEYRFNNMELMVVLRDKLNESEWYNLDNILRTATQGYAKLYLPVNY